MMRKLKLPHPPRLRLLANDAKFKRRGLRNLTTNLPCPAAAGVLRRAVATMTVLMPCNTK